MNDVDLAVVGAGPQALTLLTYLAESQPEVLRRTVVLDPSDWLEQWNRQFAAYRIPMLRSACVHHPHPRPQALIAFADKHGRGDEFHGSIGRPGAELFADYCAQLIETYGLPQLQIRTRVREVRPLTSGAVEIVADGQRLLARRVVLATNPVRAAVPSWLGEALARHGRDPGLLHASHWQADGCMDGDAVVVGGGLTAAQIVQAHADSGARVTWVTRAALRERDLDVEAPWLGPNLRRFHAARDAGARLSMARRARGGGSIPPAEHQRLGELMASGHVTHLNAHVEGVRRSANQWQLAIHHRGSSRSIPAGRVVCATGSRSQARFEPLLAHCRRDRPARRVNGMPVLDRDLAWPGTSIHLMGPLAVIGVGPASRTIIGARIAAERLLESWGYGTTRQYPGPV